MQVAKRAYKRIGRSGPNGEEMMDAGDALEQAPRIVGNRSLDGGLDKRIAGHADTRTCGSKREARKEPLEGWKLPVPTPIPARNEIMSSIAKFGSAVKEMKAICSRLFYLVNLQRMPLDPVDLSRFYPRD